MSIKTDVQELIQEVFGYDIKGVTKSLTYYSMDAAQTYVVETGEFTSLVVGDGDGALWFDDEDNSHWLGAI